MLPLEPLSPIHYLSRLPRSSRSGTNYAIYITSAEHGSIFAKGNYWGTASPDPEELFYPEDDVYYVPYAESSHFKPVVLSEPAMLELARLHEGKVLERNGQRAGAAAIYRELLETSENPQVLERAGGRLLRTVRASGHGLDGAIGIFAGMAKQHQAPDVRWQAGRLWRKALVADGQYDAARAAYEEVMTTAEVLEDRLAAQVALGAMYLLRLQDQVKAREMLEPILRDYSGHSEGYAAWALLSDVDEDLPPPAASEGDFPAVPEEPSEVVLETAPNPSNPAIMIRFSLPQAMQVRLQIYDVLGRKVRTLVPEELRLSGQHEVSWDGQDGDGRSVASGIYMVHLKANEQAYVRKVTMVR